MASVRKLDPERRYDFDLKIQNAFLNSDFFRSSKHLALYFPLPEEVSTSVIFERCILLGKKIAFPKVCLDSGKLDFYWVGSLKDLSKTRWGVKEPKASSAKLSTPHELDLIVVPGLAFDEKKYRLGRGKGFYDRTLEHFTGYKVSLAYSIQIVSEVPREAWDINVDSIISENECIS
ncbi:MAG: 5-formyltetrahydrofolate cyclo-ligase [Deltaproteobacteria bacterium]|nr:5-formyltetrahydrofolate cyclo-ligase [Deltaproteobacteria bacterium]